MPLCKYCEESINLMFGGEQRLIGRWNPEWRFSIGVPTFDTISTFSCKTHSVKMLYLDIMHPRGFNEEPISH